MWALVSEVHAQFPIVIIISTSIILVIEGKVTPHGYVKCEDQVNEVLLIIING